MICSTILSLINDVWPMIFVFSIIIISLRIIYLHKTKTKFILYKELLYLCFIIYLFVLFRVVTFQDVSWSTSNFIPFKEIFRYEIGSKLFYKNVIGNMIIFMPFGFFAAYFLKTKKFLSILLTFLISLTIEFTQLIIGRVFDIDDIILNIFGGIIGFLIYYILKHKLPSLLQKKFVYNIIIVVFLILIILYLGGVLCLK